MRSYAREVAFCKIYSYLITAESDDDFSMFDSGKLSAEDIAFAMQLVDGTLKHKAHADEIIARLSRSYKLERIYRPDLAALELAIYEMDCCDTPHPIVINEVVGLVKRYSTEKSASYVNGILAAYERSSK